MARFGYYADLRGLQLSDGNKKWIQAMRVGDYQHPAYGKISFTVDRLQRFADSVRNKVRGIALDIDYDHKADPARGNEAAGWVEDAKVEGDSLMLLVEWTKTAAEKIKEGAYRYFSPEFKDEWADSAGVQHRDVLFGGGITNRPFLKDLLPVNLSELTFAEKKERKGMTPEQLKLLGLPADATEAQINERLTNVTAAAKGTNANVDGTATAHGANPAPPQGKVGGVPFDATQAGKVDDKGNMVTPEDVQLSELAKTNPAIAMLLAERTANNQRLAALETSNAIAQVNIKLNEYRTGSMIIAPAVLDEAAKVLYKAPIALHADIHNLLKLIQGGNTTVQLGEMGHNGAGSGNVNGKTAETRADEAAAKLMTEAKARGQEIQYVDALSQVFAEDTKLFAEYQGDNYSFRI
jgi:hypothetical protein